MAPCVTLHAVALARKKNLKIKGNVFLNSVQAYLTLKSPQVTALVTSGNKNLRFESFVSLKNRRDRVTHRRHSGVALFLCVVQLQRSAMRRIILHPHSNIAILNSFTPTLCASFAVSRRVIQKTASQEAPNVDALEISGMFTVKRFKQRSLDCLRAAGNGVGFL